MMLERFLAADQLLDQFQSLWYPRPFKQSHLPWFDEHPDVHRRLLALDDAEVAHFEQHIDELIVALGTQLPGIANINDLVRLPVHGARPEPDRPTGFEWGIPGRKWQQILAFADAAGSAGRTSCTPLAADLPYLDWCCGKSHLGRWLALRTGSAVTGVEVNEALCADGVRLAEKHSVAVTLTNADVLTTPLTALIDSPHHALALHACGTLHAVLLTAATPRLLPRISLSPCCYHLGDTVLLSNAREHTQLRLQPDDVHLAVQESVTAGARERRERIRESAWRLGFDLLQRDARGVDEYLPVPAVPHRVLRRSFTDFVVWACAKKQLTLNANLALDAYEQHGWHRQHDVNRVALLRHAFRRLLELWLVWDRAHLLEQRGYTVGVSQFCPRLVTPRNVLIDARMS